MNTQHLVGIAVRSTLLAAVFGLEQLAYAATINAASCSRTDVLNAINAAVDGDRVIVPAGTCTWTSRITVSGKGIVLAGAGVGQTTIVNGANGTVLAFNLTAGDPTTYVEGFTFDANNSTGDDPMIQLGGGGRNQFRVHHISMINMRERGIGVGMDGLEVSGLIDHCTFNMPSVSGGSKAISISGTGPEESQPFSRPLALGSDKFIFIEDCTFNYGGRNDGAIDAYAGARYVFRYNNVNNTNVEHHGADSGGYRGVHSFEIYHNTFRSTSESQRKHYFRSGTGVIFNNTYSGNYTGAELTNYRSDESFEPWGMCDGTSPWDENRPGQNGYACLDQIGHVFGPTSGGANILEPLYEWNNTDDGADVDLVVGSSHANADQHIVQGRDFYNDTQRPGYTPYVYPHPLQGGGQLRPEAPTNLRIQ